MVMKHTCASWAAFLAFSLLASCVSLRPQQLPPGAGIANDAGAQPVSPHVISFSDTLAGQSDGAVTVTFVLYADQQSTTAIWTETQVVQVEQNKYSVLLGSTNADGIPPSAFVANQARWLGVQFNGNEKRYLLVSVPYAMKAMDAETLGGLLPSAFVTTQQLQSLLLNSAATGTPPAKATTGQSSTGPIAAAASGPPQPATDFLDNNATEVLLATQQGTGLAIHAVSAGDAALFAENSLATGTALKAVASSASGANIGLLAQASSPDGIAGVFDNTGGGQILSLRSNGGEVASLDNSGTFRANLVQASIFSGNGKGLFNIPPSAVGAQSANFGDSIVLRDSSGNFSASQVTANVFSGSGQGLFNIPPAAVGAQFGNFPNSIVMRDAVGSFSANQITANVFSGSGQGLFDIPPFAVGAQFANFPNSIVIRDSVGSFSANQVTANIFSGSGQGLFDIPPFAVGAQFANFPNSIVMRDSVGSFSANQIAANVFSGSGQGLFNIPPFAVGAQFANVANSVVMRDSVGSFSANQITANVFSGSGQGLFNIPPFAVGAQFANVANSVVMRDANGSFSAGGIQAFGQADFTGAISTAPVKAVLAANAPTSCLASKELLIETDAPPGQQLFICNAAGNGYVLVGDGSAAGVSSVAAGDSSVAVGGTAAAPTVAVANGGITSAKLAPNAVVGSIADGSLTPAKIAGTAATLGSNTFSGNQTMQQNLTVTGTLLNNGGITTSRILSLANPNVMSITGSGTALSVSGGNTGISISGSATALSATADFGNTVTAQNTNGTGLQGIGPVGVDALTATGVGLQARTTGANAVAATFSSANPGKLISGRLGLSVPIEKFSVDTGGNIFASGTLSTQFPNDNLTSGTAQSLLAELTPAGAAVRASDATGIIGIVISGAGFSGNAQVAYSGIAPCAFHTTTQAGHYVQNAGDGFCKDAGAAYPTSGQVVGRVVQSVGITESVAPVFLYGPEQRSLATGVTTINTGSGLSGGPITSSGTISIANTGVTNAMLQNNSVTVSPGPGLGGGGSVSLGGSIMLANTGALSFNGRSGNILPAAGDYSFSQIGGTTSSAQLPAGVVFNNLSNTFTASQGINGNLSVSGAVTGASFSGDGSALTNVNASSVGGVSAADLATISALSAESVARQSVDASLQAGISSETTARQGDVSNLQASINGVSTADAKLAQSNTFTAGTQDFSGAGATLPVRAVPSVQTPANCVAGKELLIKTDAPAGQQLFLCDAGGTTWNLVGDGASGGVTAFNGRNGIVSPSSGDYSFNQISGSLTASQLPASVVYNNQANTFGASQTINGSVSATSFTGNGGGLTNVNAATLNNLAAGSFAQLGTNNTFGGSVTASAFSGNGSGLTNVNAATVNSMQLLKLTAAITPSSIGVQSCTEQSFTVSGMNNGDVLLSVQIPSHSPGTNIAIGGWRVSAANTVAIQFCNVGRNNSSTPAAGTYVFALIR
jgi:hypothetical protein